jgi:hypothetical protein
MPSPGPAVSPRQRAEDELEDIMREVVIFASLVAFSTPIGNATAQGRVADKEKRIQQLRAEIARTQAKLDELNKELNTLLSPPAVVDTLRHEDFKVGLVGKWRKGEYAHRILEIINESSVYMAISYDPRINVVVKGISTKGLVDGAVLPLEGVWEFTGTTRLNGRTVFVIEPYTRKK